MRRVTHFLKGAGKRNICGGKQINDGCRVPDEGGEASSASLVQIRGSIRKHDAGDKRRRFMREGEEEEEEETA